MAQPPYPPQPPYGPPPGYPPPGYYPPPQQGGPYGAPYPGPRKSGSGSRWLIAILIILGGVVVFGGMFAVLAIAGVRKYLANAKTAEARSAVGAMARDAAMAFERDQTLPSGTTVHRLCPSASRSVPDSVVKVSGKKYLSSAAEWQVDSARHAGFACLRFSMTMPQYYMYSYKAHGSGGIGDAFEAYAIGDLNGDGKTSLFKSTGTVTAGGVVAVSPNLIEQDPEE
jgi:type IV pilus assembly protein PilA